MSSHSLILDGLNEVQAHIVTSDAPNLLVLAGAGSGKTRVLTSRIAWLIHEAQVNPASILAVTFTNKAALEMRERIAYMLSAQIRGPLVGTFHGIANRFLYMHPEAAGLDSNYQILDKSDQEHLVKRILKDHEYSPKEYSHKILTYLINQAKEDGQRAKDVSVDDNDNPKFKRDFLEIYNIYEQTCARLGVVDFAELLLRSCELLENNPELLEHYRQRFAHILVDEFQDTNMLQYRWLRMFSRPGQCVMVVGDDDQSIYGWRGARIENIHNFQHDYAGTQLLKLEQNYRSTGNILNAANAVIANNADRLGKDMWTKTGEGNPIVVYTARDEYKETDFVVKRLKNWKKSGHNYADAAILYRSHAQSRVIEKALRTANIPFVIIGGQSFFSRQEIKDILAYLWLIVKRDNDIAFARALGAPPRGVGNTTLGKLRQYAVKHDASLWYAAEQTLKNNVLSTAISNRLSAFMQLITDLEGLAQQETLESLAEKTLHQSGLHSHYKKDQSEIGYARLENLSEFIVACAETRKHAEFGHFALQDTQNEQEAITGMKCLEIFLNDVSLDTAEQEDGESHDQLSMMTVHGAKGLEFSLVCMVGMEDGLFPHLRSIKEGTLEEERRLCYVGMTRAKQQLCLSYAETRRHSWDGSENIMSGTVSRFINEIPKKFVTHEHERERERVASIQQNNSVDGYSIGNRVSHPTFGEGVITDLANNRGQAIAGVNFTRVGFKRLALDYAKLSVLR